MNLIVLAGIGTAVPTTPNEFRRLTQEAMEGSQLLFPSFFFDDDEDDAPQLSYDKFRVFRGEKMASSSFILTMWRRNCWLVARPNDGALSLPVPSILLPRCCHGDKFVMHATITTQERRGKVFCLTFHGIDQPSPLSSLSPVENSKRGTRLAR